jgi:hypothetical protein
MKTFKRLAVSLKVHVLKLRLKIQPNVMPKWRLAFTCKKKGIKGRSNTDAHVSLVFQQTEDGSRHVLEAAVVAAIDGELVVVVILDGTGDNNTWFDF